MPIKLGSSGSTILSDRELILELFWEDINHIEIGEFSRLEDFDEFLSVIQSKTDISFGIHSPLLRGESKYDLIESVHNDTKLAWEQLESEMRDLAKTDAEYILVHFPYFDDITKLDPNIMIEDGLR
nr:sugar phosphate isomerase/epimerase [Vallitaleaceae bacterium]